MESHKSKIFDDSGAGNAPAKSDSDNRQGLKRGLFIVAASGVTAVVAGLVTTHISRKSARENLKDLNIETKVMMESPHSLALRALAWGTFWAVGVFSLSIFSLWKLLGLKDLDDLRARIRKHRRPTEGEGRTEFESLSDFLNYLNETSKSSKPGANNT